MQGGDSMKKERYFQALGSQVFDMYRWEMQVGGATWFQLDFLGLLDDERG